MSFFALSFELVYSNYYWPVFKFINFSFGINNDTHNDMHYHGIVGSHYTIWLQINSISFSK